MYVGSLSILHTSLKKETWAICYEKKRVGKDDEKREMSEKNVSSKKNEDDHKI